MADALHAHFDLARERVAVLYPGYRAARFSPQRAAELRGGARGALGIDAHAPLVGFVTSGDFAKRGLDLFLDSAARIAHARPDARFLVVGSKELPADARDARARARRRRAATGRRAGDPERWFAALDLFLYPARFEEFGMVLAEAQAMGVPVLTSRLVGASECLPDRLCAVAARSPRACELMAARALALLADAALRAGARGGSGGERRGVRRSRVRRDGTRRLLAAQNRRLK